jgi:spoIIIJ-associated protein
MEWIEVTGRTIEDARELALDRLGVSEADLEYEVLEAAKSGFLGVGRSDARIRARVKPVSREKPSDRANRRRRRSSGDRRPGPGQAREGQPSGAGRRAGRGADGSADGAGHADSRPPKSRQSRGPRERRSPATSTNEHGSGNRAKAGAVGGTTMTDEMSPEAERQVPPTEQRDVAVEFLTELVQSFGIDATVAGEVTEEDRVEVRIDGSQLGILIGPGAATLSAIEELTQAVVQTRCDGHGGRIRVDVAGYREQRRAALEEFARDQADKVRQSGEERRLEPMGSTDRKVVHDVIAEMDDVQTSSEGEEPRRRVVIRPAS